MCKFAHFSFSVHASVKCPPSHRPVVGPPYVLTTPEVVWRWIETIDNVGTSPDEPEAIIQLFIWAEPSSLVQNQISTISVIFQIEKELQRLLGSIHSAVLKTNIHGANFYITQPPHVPWKSDSCESYFI